MWNNGNHNASCYYKPDGNVPGCGETGYKAGAVITDNAAYATSYAKGNIGSDTLKCASCSGGNNNQTFPYSSDVQRWKVTINKNTYSLTKASTTTATISCR